MRDMYTFCRIFVLTLILVGFATPSQASESDPVDSNHVIAQMVTSHDIVAPGQEFYVALSTTMDDHWHIYWKNPGDAGEPVEVHWADNSVASIGEFIWPLPEAIATETIINYGFDGRVLFPMLAKVPDDAVPGSVLVMDAEVTYLVCKDVCIPEMATLSVLVDVGEPLIDNRWSFNIDTALEVAPKKSDIKAKTILDDGRLGFEIEFDVSDLSAAYFFPEVPGMINHSAPQNLLVGDHGLRLETQSGFNLESGLSEPITGVLRTEYMSGVVSGVWLTASPDTVVDLGTLRPVKISVASAGFVTILTALIGAFLGGLILNLMPCVFPVISMKALSFAKYAHEDAKHIKTQGWLYTLGVLATFMALTLAILALKAAGSKIGWGFQLQNPTVIAGLALLFFIIGLNLLGGFEIKLGAENTGASLARKPGAIGSFFTGVLAVIVATPCTAPFMAGAIGFAMVQPAIVTLIIFMALGLGFALPFLALSYWPALLRRLPKPGPWMETFKQFMAFFMFGAVIWLIWVLSYQTSEMGIAQALASMLAVGFGVFMLNKGGRPTKLIGIAALLSSIVLLFSVRTAYQQQTDLVHEAWSTQKVAELRAEGHGVFVDFTAAWCVTCKVNEQLVLNGAGEMFEQYNTVVLVADWTNKNDQIADELARYGRSGVPMYLLFPPGNDPVSAKVLPQILTSSMLRKQLRANKG